MGTGCLRVIALAGYQADVTLFTAMHGYDQHLLLQCPRIPHLEQSGITSQHSTAACRHLPHPNLQQLRNKPSKMTSYRLSCI